MLVVTYSYNLHGSNILWCHYGLNSEGINKYVSFVVFTAVKIQIEVFWVVMPYSVAVGYQNLGGSCCLHLQCEVTSNGKKKATYIGLECKRVTESASQ